MDAPNIIRFNGNNGGQRGRMAVNDLMRMYDEAKQVRSPYEPDWRMNSAYCLPRHYGAWLNDGATMTPNTAATRRFAYDATAARALPKFAAILRRLAIPDGHRWSKLQATHPSLMKSHRVRDYLDNVNNVLFRQRYDPRAMFSQSMDEVFIGLGCYGTAPMRFKWRMPRATVRTGGFAYKAMSLKDCFPVQNEDGGIDTMFVRHFLNARQFQRAYPDWTPPRLIAIELSKTVPSETRMFEIVHVVMPRPEADVDPGALSGRRHPFASWYFSVEDKEFCGPDAGFRSFPYMVPRTATEPGSMFGYSPAQQASAAMGSVNAMKKTMLRQGQKAADPPLLAADDGVLSGKVGQIPGYTTFGAVNSAGQPLVHAIPIGDFQPAKELLQDDRKDIEDAFLVVLFQILVETPEMTATEVIERTSEKAALAAPTMGRLQTGLLGPEIERSMDLMYEYAPYMMPEMPDELKEARGEYEIVYTSPLAKQLSAEEDAGFFRVLENALNYVQATQDPEPLDWFNMDVALPEIADHQSVPTRWMRALDDVDAIRTARAKAAQQQQMIDAAPGVAALGNAGANMQKAQNG